ncbi:MAG TPA: cysteine peptidase family C39 domain-containing protein [Sedimentisphaerales bacterium]|nr:cysteine peptidase family C39 domain-containing protein [Sedimentisphaerales bacterium]
MKDLKVAAEKLGLAARGYKLTVEQLQTINVWAILPIGRTAGTEKDPLHFILVKETTDRFATIVNSRNLQAIDIPLSQLENIWTGYALLVSANPETPFFRQHNRGMWPFLTVRHTRTALTARSTSKASKAAPLLNTCSPYKMIRTKLFIGE